jgi:hypothetical protein
MVGGALVVIGAVVAFLLLTVGAFGFIGRIDHLARIDVPGTRTIHLDHGTVTVFDEPLTGRAVGPPELSIRVRPHDGGRLLAVVPPRRSERYVIEGRNGVAVAAVAVPASGRYRVEVDGPPTSRIAIGPSPRRALTLFGGAALVVALLGVGGGVLVLGVTWRRRRASMSKRLSAARGAAG